MDIATNRIISQETWNVRRRANFCVCPLEASRRLVGDKRNSLFVAAADARRVLQRVLGRKRSERCESWSNRRGGPRPRCIPAKSPRISGSIRVGNGKRRLPPNLYASPPPPFRFPKDRDLSRFLQDRIAMHINVPSPSESVTCSCPCSFQRLRSHGRICCYAIDW